MCSVKSFGFCLVFYFIRVGLGMEYGVGSGMASAVRDLLVGLNAPLKLTVLGCWSPAETVKFIRHISNGEKNFQIKISNDANPTILNIFERHQELLLADLRCNSTSDLFSKITRVMFNFYKIIVFDGSAGMDNNSVPDTDTKIRRLFHNCPILPMSQIFFISNNFTSNQFFVKQVYRLGMNEPLIMYDFESVEDLTAVMRRRNFKGFQLKASMVILNNDSLNHLDDYRDVHLDSVSKVGYQLTNHVTKFLNGTVNYSIVPTWGYLNKTTGQLNGMVGELVRNEADIGTTGLFFTPERVSQLEFITRPTIATISFIFKAPQLSYTNNLYALPFERLLWICLVVLVIVIAMFLCGAVIIELKLFKSLEIDCRVNDVYMIVYGAVCQQGASVVPNSVTGRLVTAIAFMALMLVFVSYSANIVALLQSPSNQIKTIRDLYESKMDASVEDNPYNRNFFPLVTETIRKKFFDEKVCNKNGKCKFLKLEEGMRYVREGGHAFCTELSSAYKVIGETFLDIEKCGIREISYFQTSREPWMVIPKNSSYRELIKIGMMRVKEHGLQAKENLRYFLQKPKCEGGGGNFVSVTLDDINPVVVIMAWGFGATVVIFICELILAKFNVIHFGGLTAEPDCRAL